MHFGIIAAGEGSRLCSEGVEAPKPLVKLNGEPMIGRLVRLFVENGAESVNVVVNSRMPEVAAYLRELAAGMTVPLNVAVKSTPSSMHSFFELSEMMDGKGRFILTTVDTIFRADDFARYVKAYASAPGEVDCMMAVTGFVDDEKPLYVMTGSDMDVTAFLDAPEPGVKFISGGIYGLGPKAVDVLRRCVDSGVSRMRNYQRALVADGLKVKAFDLGKIIDVDHASDITVAEAFISSLS